jgi:hypothetical protein
VRRVARIETALSILFCVFALSLAGCATFEDNFPGSSLSQDNFPPWDSPGDSSPGTSGQEPYRSRDEITQPPTADEKAVLASAQALIGMPPESVVTVNGRTFVLDCIGTVSAIFYGMSIDVQRDFRRYKGDGVGRLYQSLAAMHVLHRDLYPRAGDIIFWDNTWDAKGDGKLDDDPLTHAGVVLSVDADGTIHYVHEHVVKGVTVEAMNLLHPRDYYDPRGRIINNAMAMNSGISRRNNPPHWTSGDLWDSFGDILRVQDHFAVAGAPPGRERPAEDRLAVRPPDQP